MPTLRALRLLNAVEAGTVSGAQLQTYLNDTGRAAEFSSLLSSRGQSRRMAGCGSMACLWRARQSAGRT